MVFRQRFLIYSRDMVKRNDTVNPNEEISNLNVTGYTCGHVLGTDCQVDFVRVMLGYQNIYDFASPNKSIRGKRRQILNLQLHWMT